MKTPSLYWITAILYTVFIFFLSVFALDIGKIFGGDIFYDYALNIAGILFISGLLVLFGKKYRQMTGLRWLALAGVLSVYACFYFNLENKIEEIHLINFSLLTILYKKAFENSRCPQHAYWKAGAVSIFAGGLDEFIQRFVPGRFAQWHDVGLCLVGALLGVGLAWILNSLRNSGPAANLGK